MTTQTPTLTDFLEMRIAEDEAVAQEATTGPWTGYAVGRITGTSANPDVADAVKSWNVLHIARHDPARVLAECASKRAIVALHEPIDEQPNGWCQRCDGDGWPCGTMSALASIYADHPDYRSEWAS